MFKPKKGISIISRMESNNAPVANQPASHVTGFSGDFSVFGNSSLLCLYSKFETKQVETLT
jgi:hypothetical protein